MRLYIWICGLNVMYEKTWVIPMVYTAHQWTYGTAQTTNYFHRHVPQPKAGL